MADRNIVYLGWQGRSNYGDDLLFESWQLALGGRLKYQAPLYSSDLIKQWSELLRGRLKLIGKDRLILVGGGTVLGFENWSRHLVRGMRMFGTSSVHIVGAGSALATDSYAVGLQAQSWDSWRNLKSISIHGVRGPLTQSEMLRNGFDQPIVTGDPALMYPLVASIPVNTPNPTSEIGVCLGTHSSTRFDVEKIVQALEIAQKRLGSSGFRVFQLSDTDTDVALRLSRRLAAPIHVYNHDVKATTERIGACSVFVSERLHGAVASVALGVPTVPLSYASKCDDFWASVHGERASIKPGHSVDSLVSEILRQTDDQVNLRAAKNVRVLARRTRSIADDLNKWLSQEDTAESWR